MTHDEMIAVITHHKNGGEVEYKRKDEARWKQVTTKIGPAWDFDLCDYRAKPEPLVLWIATDSDKRVIYADKSKPLTHDLLIKVRKFVEVEE